MTRSDPNNYSHWISGTIRAPMQCSPLLSFSNSIQPAGFSTLALALADRRDFWHIPSVVTSQHSNFEPSLNQIASGLTNRCGLADRVMHICGDALSYPAEDATFDAVVSWM